MPPETTNIRHKPSRYKYLTRSLEGCPTHDSGAGTHSAMISARRFLEVAGQFSATAEQRRLRDAEQGGSGPGIAGHDRLDLCEETGFRPLAHIGVARSRADEVLEERGHAVGPGRRAHGQPGRASSRRALELAAVGAVREAEHLRAAPGDARGEAIGGQD